MKKTTQTIALVSGFICRGGDNSSALALSMSISGNSKGRRSFLSKAATTAGLVGTTSSLGWFNPTLPLTSGDHSNKCVCDTCTGLFGPRPANAIELKQGIEDKTEKRGTIELAFEKQVRIFYHNNFQILSSCYNSTNK